ILDEPTDALAVAEVEAVLEPIRRVYARGVSVILLTYSLQDQCQVRDRLMVMHEGTNCADRRGADIPLIHFAVFYTHLVMPMSFSGCI
ncbi:hypothetical protein AAER89_29675, partial [Klebsiella pneumoniae]